MIRIILPPHLKTIANTDDEVNVEIEGSATLNAVLDALEKNYPTLNGTIRDQTTRKRRPMIRFFACEEDLSNEPPDALLPDTVASGKEPLYIIGAIAGGVSNKKLNLRTLITAVIVLGITVYTFIGCWKGLDRTYIEDDWKSTKGKILAEDAVIEGKKNIARKTEGIEQAINYEYEIDGKKYKSNAVSKEVFVITADYPEGTVVDVYYNPTDPTDSVLVRSRVQKQYIVAVMVFCIVLASVVIFCTVKDLKQ